MANATEVLTNTAEDIIAGNTPSPQAAGAGYAATLRQGALYLAGRLGKRATEEVSAMLFAARQLGYLAGQEHAAADAEPDDGCSGYPGWPGRCC